jgi:cytochrome c oxidase assembly protein subunit 11
LKPGEVHTVKFNVINESGSTSSGSASFNVSPSPFGIYLNKIGCFCFEKQTLKAGEKQEFVLTFFLDPKVVEDNKTKDIADVTLSFTFFSSDYYNKNKI